MKHKAKRKSDHDLEDRDDDADIDAGGPSISSNKANKMLIVLASSILITAVMYFLFIKEPAQKSEEKLEEVKPVVEGIAPSDTGKSPFEIEKPQEIASGREDDFLKKPSVPTIPSLPELPVDVEKKEELNLTIESNNSAQLPLNPTDTASPTSGQSMQTPQIQIVQNQLPPGSSPTQQGNAQVPNQQATGQNQNYRGQNSAGENIDPRYAPILVFAGGAPGVGVSGVGYENNIVQISTDSISQLQTSQPPITATRIEDMAHTLSQGKLFTAILETAINTEVPGFVRAIISRDVYGESGNSILISRGSRLFGTYSSNIQRGQARVTISWTRLIRPDGIDLAINVNASDQFGRAGIPGEVDNKYGSIIASSLLTSVLALGSVIAAEKIVNDNSAAGSTTTTNPSLGSVTSTGKASNQAIYDFSKTIMSTVGQVLNNGINTSPVVRIPQGTKITVVVNGDLKIPSLVNR